MARATYGIRLALLGVFALSLIALAVIGIDATATHFAPCDVSQTTPECYAAMDGAGSFYGTVQQLWIVALALTVASVATVSGRAGRVLCIIAAGLVLVMNVATEYAIWLGIAGGHWDVPPGTGSTQSAAFGVAGILIAAAGVVWMLQVRREKAASSAIDEAPRASAFAEHRGASSS